MALLAQDSTTFFQKVSEIFPQGDISAGYDYGYLPFLVQNNPPIGNFKSDGNFQIQLKSLPFRASFYYSSLGTISGLNNHFTIKFDAQKYRDQLMEKLKLNDLNRIELLDSLGKVKQKLKTKLDYLYLIKDRKIALPIDSSRYSFPGFEDLPQGVDSIGYDIELPDSLASTVEIDTPDVQLPQFKVNDYMDSVGREIDLLLNQVGELEEKVGKLKEINALSQDSLMKIEMSKAKSPWMKKINNFMGNVQRLDVGLTYPNYSQFLVARIPIRGVNFEYQKKELYFAFTHGKTVNNIFFTNDVIRNNLNSARNLYNFFDFNNIDDGRRVTVVKAGIGKKEETHLHVGVLYGLGKISYQDTSQIVDTEKNFVVEIDGSVKIKKAHLLSLNYGRSAIQVNNVNLGEEGSLLNQFMDINDRTNALLGTYQLSSQASQLELKFRWIDPYYRSFGVGFLRSDNIRYEIKYKQKIGKKIKTNLYFRRENDNLLGLYNYQNVLLSYGAGISYRPTKHFMLKADMRPIVLDANNDLDSLSITNNNLIVNWIVNYNNRVNKTYFNVTGVYSYYQLTLDDSLQVYQNVNLNFSIESEKFSNVTIFNHYRTTDTSSVPLTSLVQNNITLKLSKLSLTGMLKGSFTQNQKFDFGYGVSLQANIMRGFSLRVSFEKLVVGDFYNSIYNSNLLDYPYRTTSSLVFRW